MPKPRVAYAANRRIGLKTLKIMLEFDWTPVVLITTKGRRAECADELRQLLPGVPLIEGKAFRETSGIHQLRTLNLDYFLSVHFPYIIPQEILEIPNIGTLNLHPAYLPYNRGWHTPTWALWDETPYGATLHWIDDDRGVDTGDIALQERLEILPEDTAHSLYQRVLALEEKLFRRAVPLLLDRCLPRKSQDGLDATTHMKKDLIAMQPLDLKENVQIGKLLRRLRALTTNDWSEAAYFEANGSRYQIQVNIRKEDPRA
jgi:methionyl-tRNA formyltransferase